MKSKITLVVLCLIIVVLGSTTIYLGLNKNKSRENIDELTNKIEELSKNVEEKEQTIENIKEVLGVEKEEQTNDVPVLTNKGNVKTYFNEDESIMLMLSEYKGRNFSANKSSSVDVHYFAYDELAKNAILNQVTGEYYFTEGKINFISTNNFSMGKITSSANPNGRQILTIDYDENSDIITIGNVTLKLKK